LAKCCAATAANFLRARRGHAVDAALIGYNAGHDILLRLPHGVAGLV